MRWEECSIKFHSIRSAGRASLAISLASAFSAHFSRVVLRAGIYVCLCLSVCCFCIGHGRDMDM